MKPFASLNHLGNLNAQQLSSTVPLNLVAITNGAKVIRQRLVTVFDPAVVVILDWYHLCQKLRGLMSMIASNRVEKSRHLKFLLSPLWQGKTATVLEYLRNHVVVKNQDKWQELVICRNINQRLSTTIAAVELEKLLVVGR